jgi:hypothetical protein
MVTVIQRGKIERWRLIVSAVLAGGMATCSHLHDDSACRR